jgi:hypothetical protein
MSTPDRPLIIPSSKFLPVEHDGDIEGAPRESLLTVDLGGERIRCLVRRVIDEDTVMVEVASITFTRGLHPYKQGDFVGAKRTRHMGGRDEWVAVKESAIAEAERAKLLQEKRDRDAEKAAQPTPRKRGERKVI